MFFSNTSLESFKELASQGGITLPKLCLLIRSYVSSVKLLTHLQTGIVHPLNAPILPILLPNHILVSYVPTSHKGNNKMVIVHI